MVPDRYAVIKSGNGAEKLRPENMGMPRFASSISGLLGQEARSELSSPPNSRRRDLKIRESQLSDFKISLSLLSEPESLYHSAKNLSRGNIPEPPIPTMCILLTFERTLSISLKTDISLGRYNSHSYYYTLIFSFLTENIEFNFISLTINRNFFTHISD